MEQIDVAPLRLVLADGHRAVREALAQRLGRSAVRVVAAVSTLAEAKSCVRRLRPDVVLCDPRTLGASPIIGVQVLGAYGCPIVVLTTSLDGGEEEALRAAGAKAVLLKGCPFAVLRAQLQATSALGATAMQAPHLIVGSA